MKIWITRQRAISLQIAGINRLNVWFVKPTYIRAYYDVDNFPIGFKEEGCYTESWEVRGSGSIVRQSLSFGELFGYPSDESNEHKELGKFVWEKLCEHFGNTKFEEWHIYEQEGKCNRAKFLLEIDLDIKMI